ncbi:MAG: T9SS type A sorting domain-containing protein [FCB group bacterium]
MYKFFTFSLLLTVSLTLNLAAQNFKASDGLSKAQATTTLTDPELWGIGTVDTTVQVQIKFDMSNGTSNVWLYIFHSKSTGELNFCAVTLGTLFGVVVPQPPAYDRLPFKPNKPLTGVNWIDSDVMLQDLKNSTEYQTFATAHPNTDPSMVALSINNNAPGLTVDSPYWMFKFDIVSSNSYVCAVEAISGQVTCFTLTDVADAINGTQSNLFIYPNPSANNAFLYIPKSIQSPQAQLAIYDIEGNKVMDLIAPHNGETELVILSLCNYIPGIYFVKYNYKDRIYTNQLVIQR